MKEVFPPKPYDFLSKDDKNQILSEIAKLKIVKKEILESVPSETEGLNLKRVDNFMKSLGLPVRDYVLFNDEKSKISESIIEIFKKQKYDYDKDAYSFDWAAMCSNDLDLIFVKRDKEEEIPNKHVDTEALLVHELAHGSSGFSGCVVDKEDNSIDSNTNKKKVIMPRLGFSIGKSFDSKMGDFLEEGFADMLAGKYYKENMDVSVKQKLLKIFKHKYGDSHFFNFSTNTRSGLKNLPIPMHHGYLSSDNSTQFSYRITAMSAFGLELLCAKSPGLFDAMIEARADVNKLRYVIKTIDKISPGLYPELRKLKYTQKDLSEGLYLILDRVYDGKLGDYDFSRNL